MRSILRRPLILIPLILAGLFLAYLAAGYWLAPRLIRSSAQDWVATKLQHKTLALGDIHFNPFNLTLDMANIAVADTRAPAEPLVSVRHLGVNISARTLFTFKPKLDSVTVDAPAINAVLRKDGTLNLVELVPPDDGKPTPDVWIGKLAVNDGSASFTDLRTAKPRQKTLAPITFTLADFATTRDAGGGYKLDAASTEGEKFHWDGKVSMAPLASNGRFTVSALKLTSLYRFIDDRLPVALTAGTLDLAGDYVFAAPPVTKDKTAPAATPLYKFDANVTQLQVADLGVRTVDGDDVGIKSLKLAPTHYSLGQDSATIGAVAVNGITLARRSGERAAIDAVALASTTVVPSKQALDTGGLKVSGLQVTGRGKGGENVKLGEFTVASSHIDAVARNATIGAIGVRGVDVHAIVAADNSVSIPGLYPMVLPKSKTPATGTPWHYSLAGLTLEDTIVRLTLAKATPAKDIVLAPVQLQMGGVTDAMDTPVPLSLAVGINKTAHFTTVGKVNPGAGSAQLAINLERLPLADYVALAATPPGVIVHGGLLGVKGKLDIVSHKAAPDIGFTGDVNIVGLDLNTRADDSDLLSWARLDITGINYASTPAKLAIKRVVIDRPVSQVTIQSDAQLNLQEAAGTADAAAPPKPVPPKAIGNVRVRATMSNALAQAGTQLPITIGEVVFKDGTIAFSDFSINPSFAAKIQGFTGSIRGLSSATNGQAEFDLHGFVIDRFSPVTITGRANPFAYDANTDITASFKNIELPVFNPYSGAYAGYAIAKGKLSTDLHYRIVNRGLQAEHHIVVDQLEWGEATNSKPKVSVPVKLATSLLKDSNGVITLDLPVTGSLDDPKFSIWPIVWQVVGNVLTKIVEAPFKLIGSLFAGAEKAQFIVFLPGSAVLTPDSGTNLAALAKGLASRPEVKLDIPAGPGIKEDAEALTTTKIQTTALAADKKAPAAYADLSDGDKADRLKKVYKKAFGKGPDFPKDVPTANIIAGKEAKATAATAQVKWLETELRAKMAPTDAELAALGQSRADAVKQALLADNAITPERVFVNTATGVVFKDDKIEMELKTKN
jgi:hypothetical protein